MTQSTVSIEHVRQTIADEKVELQINKQFASEASPVASSASAAFRDIESSIRSVFGLVASLPGLTNAATDSRYYAKVSDDADRIKPFKVDNSDIKRFHGIDERLSVEN